MHERDSADDASGREPDSGVDVDAASGPSDRAGHRRIEKPPARTDKTVDPEQAVRQRQRSLNRWERVRVAISLPLIAPGAAALVSLSYVFFTDNPNYKLPGPDFYTTSAQVLAALIIAVAVESRAQDFLRGPGGLFYKLQLLMFLLGGELFAFLGASGALGASPEVDDNGLVVAQSVFLSNLIAAGTTCGLVGGFVAVALLAITDKPWLVRKIELRRHDCEGDYRMTSSDVETSLEIVNESRADISVEWLNESGIPQNFARIPAGQNKLITTYRTHPWRVLSAAGECIGIYLPEDVPGRVTLTD